MITRESKGVNLYFLRILGAAFVSCYVIQTHFTVNFKGWLRRIDCSFTSHNSQPSASHVISFSRLHFNPYCFINRQPLPCRRSCIIPSASFHCYAFTKKDFSLFSWENNDIKTVTADVACLTWLTTRKGEQWIEQEWDDL